MAAAKEGSSHFCCQGKAGVAGWGQADGLVPPLRGQLLFLGAAGPGGTSCTRVSPGGGSLPPSPSGQIPSSPGRGLRREGRGHLRTQWHSGSQ